MSKVDRLFGLLTTRRSTCCNPAFLHFMLSFEELSDDEVHLLPREATFRLLAVLLL